MDTPALLFFCGVLFGLSVVYSSAGQAGASGYIAAMALFGFAPTTIKPTALALNIVVSAIATFRFFSEGHFRWRLFWPLAVLSVPAALVGGCVSLPSRAFNVLLGATLLIGAFPFFRRVPSDAPAPVEPRPAPLLLAGGIVGLLSGLTAIGGGILLTPLVLFLRWANTKTAAAVSAAFILANSIVAMAGHLCSRPKLPPNLFLFGITAAAGGLLGSHLGSAVLPPSVLRRVLGAILIVAGAKLLVTK